VGSSPTRDILKNHEDKMTTEEYKIKVITLFKSGKATDEQYKEMAEAVLKLSEDDIYGTRAIDEIADPENYDAFGE